MKNRKLRFLLVITILLLVACSQSKQQTGKYTIVIGAGRGKTLFAQRIIYATDEYGNVLNMNLPKSEELGSNPVWSPDGKWIAHVYTNPNPTSASDNSIYLMRTNDFGKNFLVVNDPTANMPAWSPDGSQLAFYAYGRNIKFNYGIYTVNLACILQKQNCAPKPMFLISGIDPSWSPDGKKILYRAPFESYGVYIVDIHNPSQVVNLNNGLDACGFSPQWSPNGTKIAFACEKGIYLVGPDGKNPVYIPINTTYLRWSPDGKKIAFIGDKDIDKNLGQILDIEGTVTSTAVFIMDENGTNINRVTKSNEESIGWFEWIGYQSTTP